MSKRNSVIWIILLQGMMLLYSCSGVFTKLAAGYPFLSWGFIFSYGGAIGVLFVYALLWQLVLKKVPLSVAYANRAMTTGWTLFWGVVLFHETVSPTMLIGTAVMAVGIYLVVTSDE